MQTTIRLGSYYKIQHPTKWKESYNKLMKSINGDDMKLQVIELLHGIVQYFTNRTNYKTTQQIIGIDLLFWGIILKN